METTIIFISSKKSKKIKKYIDQSLIFSYIIYVIDSEGKKKEKEMLAWCNWQPHKIQVLVSKDVRVQVSLPV